MRPSSTTIRAHLAAGLTADEILAQHPLEDRRAVRGLLTNHGVILRSGGMAFAKASTRREAARSAQRA